MGELDRIRREGINQPYLSLPMDQDCTPEESCLREIFDKLWLLNREVMSLQWKKVDKENLLEARIDITGGKCPFAPSVSWRED